MHRYLLSLTLLLTACPDDPKRPLGAECDGNGECESGLCFDAICIDPAADDDLDTLINAYEVGLGANPTKIDSDDDGKLDVVEVPGLVPVDSDGDGRPDIIESAIADADGDCIVDELDDDDDNANPAGCTAGPITSCDDVYRQDPSTPTGPRKIDPDGDGPLPTITIECLMGPGNGGSGRLDATYLATLGGDTLRRYLVINGRGVWALSPPTRTVFDFTVRTHVPGAWFVFDPASGLDSFTCPATPTEDGIGVGCFVPDGAYGSNAAAAVEGRLQVCGAAMGGCSEATVYTRVDHCGGTEDNIVSDGELDGLDAATSCWRAEAINGGGGGLGGNVFIDEAGARAGHAPAIRAEEYKTETYPWLVMFQHDHLPFAANHAYRLSFWARGAAPRQLLLNVGPSDASHTEYLYVDTEWREYSIDFAATDTSLDGSVGFYLGVDEDGTTLWLDSIALTDLGPDACNSNESNPVRGGDFTYGAACWERIQSNVDHYGALTTDADAPVTAPSLRVDQRGESDDSVPYIAQRNLLVEAGHAYDLAFAARAAEARPLDVIFTADNPLSVTLQTQRGLATTWQQHHVRFLADPEQGTGNALLMFMFGQGGTATVWLDDVRLTDLGTDPCVPIAPELIDDAGFDFGTRCWFTATATLTSIETVFDDDGSGSAPYLYFRNTTATTEPELGVHHVVALAAVSHTVSIRAKADVAGRVIIVRVMDPQSQPLHTQRITLSDTWATYPATFANTVANPNAVLFIDVGGADTTAVSLDDVRVFPTP